MTHGTKVEEGNRFFFTADQLEALVREGRQVLRCLLHQDIAELIYLENPQRPGTAERWHDAICKSQAAQEGFWRWYHEDMPLVEDGRGTAPALPSASPDECSPFGEASSLVLSAATRQQHIEAAFWQKVEARERGEMSHLGLSLMHALAEYRAALRALLAAPLPR